MAQSDRRIEEKDRCPACDGVGWTWWEADTETAAEARWIVCRACIGTGRADHKGRKRTMPAAAG